jgi:predicted nicotinamide N-methyase
MNAERLPDFPYLPETPPDALGPEVREAVYVEDRTFVITRPSDGDRLLDHPAVRAAFAADEYMPYWVDLWPAARMLAKVILREQWQPGLEALEVGCGLGLPGVVGLSVGMRVTFSDYDATALRYAAANARANGFADFKTLQLDWRHPPAGLQVPVILAADLIYELRNVAPLVGLIKQVLAPGGVALVTDQDRVPSHVLRQNLEEERLAYEAEVVRAGEPGGRRVKGTLYRIRHPAE